MLTYELQLIWYETINQKINFIIIYKFFMKN